MTYWLDLFGVAVFAVTGALAAGRKRMDLFGVLVLAMVTAVGGGTTRDLLLGVRPVFWVEQPVYLGVIIGAALTTVGLQRRLGFLLDKPLIYFDAFGLALFAVLGAQKALFLGSPTIVCIVMGVLTGTFGGVIRDTISDKFPLIFRSDLYATCAVLGAGVYVVLARLGLGDQLATTAGVLAGLGLRLAAIRWHLDLPIFSLDKSE